jgi:ribosome-associated protein
VVATDDARSLALVAAQAAADKKAQDLVLLDVSDQLVITDCFVIASAPNERQVESIVEAVEEKLRKAGTKRVRREGEREGRWVLLDFVDVVVHVQHVDERAFYGLERLWKDCPRIEFEDSGLPAEDGGDEADGGDREDGGEPDPADESEGTGERVGTGDEDERA